MKCTFRVAGLLLAGTIAAQASASSYKIANRFPIDGSDSWDYITVDSTAHRLYVSHSVRVNVLDADTGAPMGVSRTRRASTESLLSRAQTTALRPMAKRTRCRSST